MKNEKNNIKIIRKIYLFRLKQQFSKKTPIFLFHGNIVWFLFSI